MKRVEEKTEEYKRRRKRVQGRKRIIRNKRKGKREQILMGPLGFLGFSIGIQMIL